VAGDTLIGCVQERPDLPRVAKVGSAVDRFRQHWSDVAKLDVKLMVELGYAGAPRLLDRGGTVIFVAPAANGRSG
jgi:hypothetical protein